MFHRFRPSRAASLSQCGLFVARRVGFHLQELTSALPLPHLSPLIPSSSHLCRDYTFASLTCDDVTTFFWQQTFPLPSNSLLSEKPPNSLAGSRSSHLLHLFLFKVLIFLSPTSPNAFLSKLSMRAGMNEINRQRDFSWEDEDLVLLLCVY